MKLRVGVIGTGFGAEVQIPAFLAHPRVEVVAIASGTPGRAREVAGRFEIPHAFDDYRAMVATAELDLVSITSPPDTHHPATLAALARRRHVLCEKPMALNAAQAEEMLREAERQGVTHVIDHELRFNPNRRKIKRLIEERFIGAPRHALITVVGTGRADATRPWTWWSDARRGGGILGAQGKGPEVHDIAQILAQLLGEGTDLVGPAVDPIDGLQKHRFGHHRDVDFLAGEPRDLIEGEQVGGIDHRDQHRVVLLLEQKRAETPCLGFGQFAGHRGIEVVILQVDERNTELAGERLADLVLRKIPAFDQHPAQLSTRAALILERPLELLLRDKLLLQEQIAEPYPLGTLGSDCLGHDPSLPSPLQGDFRLSSRARYRFPGKGANSASAPPS